MKRIISSILLLALALGLMAFQSAPITPQADCAQFVLGQSCTLKSGEKLADGMVLLGGSAVLEEGSIVEGDVVILGGNLMANGRIEGDLNLAGGSVSLGESALVEGDVNSAGGSLHKADGAKIEGKVNENVPTPFVLPGRIQVPNWSTVPSTPASPLAEPISAGLGLIWGAMWWVMRSVLWAIVALLVALMLPERTQRVTVAAVGRPVEAGGMGCLTMIVAPIVIVILVVTICGIPFALLGMLVLAAAWALGTVALGAEVGKRLVGLTTRDVAPAVTTAIGTFVLTLVTNGIGYITCVGWMVPAVVGAVGIGAALITRFGGEPTIPPAAAPTTTIIDPVTPAPAYPVPPVVPPYDVADPAPVVADEPPAGQADVYDGDLPEPRP